MLYRAVSLFLVAVGSLVYLLSYSTQILHAQESTIDFTPVFVDPDRRDVNALAWGDMDGDGDLDLAFGAEPQTNRIYENVNGQLHFDPANGIGWESPDKMPTWSLAWGDMDGDGDLDLAVGNSDSPKNEIDYGAPNQIFRNDGDGNFELAWTSPDAWLSESVVWGDVNGDGALDLVVGNLDYHNQVFLNDGFGQFELAWESPEIKLELRDLLIGGWDISTVLYERCELEEFAEEALELSELFEFCVSFEEVGGGGWLTIWIFLKRRWRSMQRG